MALLLQHEKSDYIRANMSAFFLCKLSDVAGDAASDW